MLGRVVVVDGEKKELTPKEYDLLVYLIKNKNIIDYTVKPGLLQQLSDRMGAAFAQQISANLGILPHGFH